MPSAWGFSPPSPRPTLPSPRRMWGQRQPGQAAGAAGQPSRLRLEWGGGGGGCGGPSPSLRGGGLVWLREDYPKERPAAMSMMPGAGGREAWKEGPAGMGDEGEEAGGCPCTSAPSQRRLGRMVPPCLAPPLVVGPGRGEQEAEATTLPACFRPSLLRQCSCLEACASPCHPHCSRRGEERVQPTTVLHCGEEPSSPLLICVSSILSHELRRREEGKASPSGWTMVPMTPSPSSEVMRKRLLRPLLPATRGRPLLPPSLGVPPASMPPAWAMGEASPGRAEEEALVRPWLSAS